MYLKYMLFINKLDYIESLWSDVFIEVIYTDLSYQNFVSIGFKKPSLR